MSGVLYAMQEAPYMHANGSGYLPDVMRRVSEAYRAQYGGDNELAFDVVPVRTWQQLLSRARTSRWVSCIVHVMFVINIIERTRQ